MAKSKFNSLSALVYSTDPDFKPATGEPGITETSPAKLQQLKVRLDTKHRAGKAVTLVQGFTGTDEDREILGKKLKTFCGTGGSVKDNDIIIQGDNRDKVLSWLQKNGYTAARKI